MNFAKCEAGAPRPPPTAGNCSERGTFYFSQFAIPTSIHEQKKGGGTAAVTSGLDVPFADYLTSGKSFPCSEPQCPQLKNGCVCWGGYVYVICKVVSGFKEKMGATPPLQVPDLSSPETFLQMKKLLKTSLKTQDLSLPSSPCFCLSLSSYI